MEYVLSIDLGTSYFKAGLFEMDGTLRGLGRVAVPVTHPKPDRSELTVANFLDTVKQAIEQAVAQAGGQANGDPAKAVRAVSYSSQANTFLVTERGGKPVTPFIMWPDHRAEPVDRVVENLWRHPEYHRTMGHGFQSPEFFVAKLRWIQMHRPDLWFPAERFLTISDYLTFILTGEERGDRATAQLLGMWDMQRERWSLTVLKALGLRRRQMAEVFPPGTVAGRLQESAARDFGLPAGIPVAVGTLDHHAAALGAGLDRLAPMSESTGTVLAALRSSERYICHPEYTVGPGPSAEIAPDAKPWYWLAFDPHGAAALESYHRCYVPDASLKTLLNLAADVPPGSEGLYLDPAVGDNVWTEPGAAPKGFMGAKPVHRPPHYVRAILESRAAILQRLTHILFGGEPPRSIVATGGGARSDLWLQIKADMLNVQIIRPACAEAACLGAALFAAIAAGWYANLSSAQEGMVRAQEVFEPDVERHQAYMAWRRSHPGAYGSL